MLRAIFLASLAMISSGYPWAVSPQNDIEISVRHLNEARRAAGLHDLTWDASLAQSAQSWADKLAEGEVPHGYSLAQYPVSGEAIYEEETATDCVGQSFEATLQSAVGNWLHKWEAEPGEETKTNHDACMASIAEYVGCGKAFNTHSDDGEKKCKFYDVCFFGHGLRTPPKPKTSWAHHWGHPIYVPTPFKFTPIEGSEDSEEEAKLEFSGSED
ncbi:hypothetical protein FPSE_03140 [Fusarium pseudograminearum CS3096]|uniref:SCP domain-containing protein n=1 Tax=Fusarium pseudograminearum (strain CS3096) TaxID=1028729 RepID=K3VPB1_FUSPC|nr:hypothetical protein FPSE_03140 [Fusarium pseudograminearum CS3096]EKJ76729.1 hypothetical protein FPSE_03140 [Fusarium pseudograminearum CS3096]KAF0645161.1 hypothetical protein FPSE5266_03140 [Fusarium pseudograminearum]